MRAIGRVAGWVAAVLALLVLGYAAAGLAGGAIPANAGWRPATGPDAVTVWVESNGIHVGFVVPKVAAGVDWRPLARAADLADPRYARFDHLAIGWGERRFFLETATWADVRPGPLLGAALGSDATLLHLEHVPAPRAGDPDVRAIRLRPAEYRRLAAYILASVAPGGAALHGYGASDVFLPARGRYDAARTCNAWAGAALRHAGVRVGRWTPFPVTVMGWF